MTFLSVFVVRRATLREVGSQKQSYVAEFYEVCPDEANLHSANLRGIMALDESRRLTMPIPCQVHSTDIVGVSVPGVETPGYLQTPLWGV